MNKTDSASILAILLLAALALLQAGCRGAGTATESAAERSYEPEKALLYARTRWTHICHDSYVCFSSNNPNAPYKKVAAASVFVRQDGKEEFLKEPSGKTWTDPSDCAHFVSCCVGNPGGGCDIGSDYPNGPYGRLNPQNLLDKLAPYIEKQTNSLSLVEAKKALSALRPGDLIFYQEGTRFHHVGLYLGGEKIACHSYCRCDTSDANDGWADEWDSVGGGTKAYKLVWLKK